MVWQFSRNRMEELGLCALKQGYGKDLKPLYKQPIIDLGLYVDLLEILKRMS